MKVVGNYMLHKECIGKGQFGAVCLCHKKTNPDQLYACKTIIRKRLTKKTFMNLKNEISILSKLNNEYVVNLRDLQKTENNFYMIFDYCNGGDLENLKELRGKFTENEARLILY